MDVFEPLRDLDFDAAVVVVDPVDAVATYGDPTTVYDWASVTKLVVTYACLIAVDRGIVNSNDYVGEDGCTLRHVLSHSSGLPFDKGANLAMPGQKRIYSNRGIEVAAAHVERRVEKDFRAWLRETVTGPLGMDTAELVGSPAHGMRGSAVDLAEFGRAVLNGALLNPETFRQATHVVYPGLRGVLPGYGLQDPNDWGLGFEIRGNKEPHWTGHNNSPTTFGHFGWSGSFLWIDPEVHLAACFLGSKPFAEVHQEVWPDLSDRILAEYAVLD
ncbi:CubicO group peptidase, beta-lactamase class C family [Ruaniaceae bacterium KH17]|nr:CubicO group peptidase, beta-lactamase class C family [Ruaniaceae bacterium KH17]